MLRKRRGKEHFSEKEATAIMDRFRKTEHTERNRRKRKAKQCTPAADDRTKEPKAKDPAKMAKYTDLLCSTAQSSAGDYVSFSSFLGIGEASREETNGAEAPKPAESEQESSERIKKNGPLENMPKIQVGGTRQRPKRSKEKGITSSETQKAISSLIGSSGKRAKEKPCGKKKPSSANAPSRVSPSPVS